MTSPGIRPDCRDFGQFITNPKKEVVAYDQNA